MRRRVVKNLAIACAVAASSSVGTAGFAATTEPSLSDTLNFIRDSIVAQGEIIYALHTQDSASQKTFDNQRTVEATKVTSNVSACAIDFRWRRTIDGRVDYDDSVSVPFKDVTSVVVVDMEADTNSESAKAGHPTWITKINPQVWVVSVHYKAGDYSSLDFREQSMAERVATAARHAEELCDHPAPKPF